MIKHQSTIESHNLQEISTTANFDTEKYQHLVSDALKLAKQLGASSAEVSASIATGLSVLARMGSVETLEFERDQGMGITVFFGQQKGSASTSDLTSEAISATVRAACDIAQVTSSDPCTGLADADLMASQFHDLDLYHPWALTAEQAIALALDCETQARDYDKRICNSEGASVNTRQGYAVYANSHGFLAGEFSTRHSISCALVAESDGKMQQDYFYTTARSPSDLLTSHEVAITAAKRTVAMLGARRLSTQQAPVILEAPIARSILGDFLSAIRGSAIYRKASFLLDQIDKPVFAPWVHLYEQPFLPRGISSANFDAEGVATSAKDWVKDGILQGYILGTYSARKLGLRTTGNAGGVHNFTITPGPHDFTGLLKQMDTGLLVTEIMSTGSNIITGDFSCGARGFWVEKGIIQYPVEEVTIAGNLKDMFLNMVAAGNDVDTRGSIRSGSLLFESLMIGGE